MRVVMRSWKKVNLCRMEAMDKPIKESLWLLRLHLVSNRPPTLKMLLESHTE